jgi:hypothetical protein
MEDELRCNIMAAGGECVVLPAISDIKKPQ